MAGLEEALEEVPEPPRAALAAHFELVLRWNRVHNLTRVENPVEAARVHYLDSLRGLEALAKKEGGIEEVWDIGSGAGFPGLVGAICFPDVQFHLVEPARKRASFLRTSALQLGLSNVSVVEARAEEIEPAQTVISRAALPVEALREVVRPGGTLAKWATEGEDWVAIASSWGWKGEALPVDVKGLQRVVLWARAPGA